MPDVPLKFRTTNNIAAYETAMRKVEAMGGATAKKVSGAFRGISGSLVSPIAGLAPAIAGAFAGAAIVRGVGQVFEAGRSLRMLQRETGASVAGLVVLQSKFKQAGLDGDLVATSIFRLQKSIAGVEDEENKGGSSRLRQLGLDLGALSKMAPDQQLMAVGAAIARLPDPTQRSATAMQIFGRAGAQLGAVFNGPGFTQIAPGLAQKAQMLARNAALFEQVSIKLERVGNIVKTFYAGVADRVASTLDPVLDRLTKINLVAQGQAFGTAIADGAKIFIGAFQNPEVALSALKNGLAATMLETGNLLLAGLRAGASFFQDGMIEGFQAIGESLTASLMKAFAKPIAYFQAGVEAAMQTTEYLADKASGKKDDDSLAGGMSSEDRAAKIKDLQSRKDAQYNQAKAAFDPAHSIYRNVDESLAGNTNYQFVSRTLADLKSYDPSKYAHAPESFDTIMARRQQDAARFGLSGEGKTAKELEEDSKTNMGYAAGRAAAVFRATKDEDVLGAGAYGTVASKQAAKLAAAGQRILTPPAPYVEPPDPYRTTPGLNPRKQTLPSRLDQWWRSGRTGDTLPAQTPMDVLGIDRRIAGNSSKETLPTPSLMRPSAPSTPVTQELARGLTASVIAAAMASGPVASGASAAAATIPGIAASRFEGPGGAWNRAHAIGYGGALDFDPSTRPGWTGATNAFANRSAAPFANNTGLSTGGLGGGAYGNTGNIWTQISGGSARGRRAWKKPTISSPRFAPCRRTTATCKTNFLPSGAVERAGAREVEAEGPPAANEHDRHRQHHLHG